MSQELYQANKKKARKRDRELISGRPSDDLNEYDRSENVDSDRDNQML